MRQLLPRSLGVALGLLAAVAGCGGEQAADDYQDGSANVDSGLNDGGGCSTVVNFQPVAPVAPVDIVARAVVSGASTGILPYAWRVRHDGVEIAAPSPPTDPTTILFRAATPGIYEVELFLGSSCQPYYDTLNVAAPGANSRAFRLRFVPPPSALAPPQERIVTVMGGANFSADVTLDPGTIYPLTVRTPAAAPVPAYLRFTSRSTPDAVVEGFADATGAAQVRLISGRYDVLIVPTSTTLAPRLVTDWDPFLGTLTVDAGLSAAGTVLDAAGLPVGGARVSLTSGGVPSSVATTAADGRFALRWREGATTESVTVVPGPGSDLPRLDATLELGALADLTIRHATVPSSDLGGTLVQVGGVAQPAADVLVQLTRPACATLLDGTTALAQAAGSHHRTLRTDGAGRLPAARFVDGTGGAYIGSSGPGAIAALTLPRTGPLAAAAAVTVGGHVVPSAGGTLAGARVRATLTGALAHTGAPAPSTTSAADGSFALALAAGAPYTLTVTDATAEDAVLTRTIAAASAQDLGALTLGGAVFIAGEIRVSGQSSGARGVGVAALCHLDCAGIERTRPLGEAVSDVTGDFVIAVPDPGVTQ